MRHYTKWLLCAAAAGLLSGCASNNKPQEVILTTTQYQVDTSLQQAAHQAAASLSQLAVIEKAKYPQFDKVPFTHIKAAELNQMISVNWYGPIAGVMQQIADKVGYQLQIFGKAPKTPVLISLDDMQKQHSALDLLRNIDLQAGNNASIVILPTVKILSLRYNAS